MPFFTRPAGYQMPLTPPDYMPGYSANGDGSLNLYSQQPQNYYSEKRSLEYDNFSRDAPSNYSGSYQPQNYQFSGPPPPGLTHPQHMYQNQSSAALRLPEVPIMKDMSHQRVPTHMRPAPKEEKVVGGVSAHLDYEMDQMSDFVHQMVIRQLSPTLSNLPAFRKFVSQILSSTRLPSSTVLLGLYHLARRPSGLPSISLYELQDSDVHRLLTMALLLASKFLDDNTFQNKSWAEVTGLPVGELNKLEANWLMKIGWKLHVRADEPNGFNTWVEMWERFKNGASRPATIASPVEMVIQPPMPSPAQFSPYHSHHFQVPSMLHERPMYQPPTSGHFDTWSYPPKLSQEQSPMSAPETGPPTPEYFGLPGVWGLVQPPSHSMRSMPVYPQYSQPPMYQAPAYAPGFSPWHAIGCGCKLCARSELFFPPMHYGQQVAG